MLGLKAPAFHGLHEPDDARVSCPESVSGSGCNSPGRLGNRSAGTGSKPPSAAVDKAMVVSTEGKAWQGSGQVTGKKRTKLKSEPGRQVRVLVNSKKSFNGQFRSFTDEAMIIHANGTDQTLSRSNVLEVSSRRPGIASVTR